MTEQLPDFKTLNNSQLYAKINNQAEFIKEFRVGDEIIFCSPLSNNHIISDINSVLILEINDLYVKYTNSKQFKQPYCIRRFTCNKRIEDFMFTSITYDWYNRLPLQIFKKMGPSVVIRGKTKFYKMGPSVGISFVREDYRKGKTKFYNIAF